MLAIVVGKEKGSTYFCHCGGEGGSLPVFATVVDWKEWGLPTFATAPENEGALSTLATEVEKDEAIEGLPNLPLH